MLALVITAEDDPVVPAESFRDPAIAVDPNVTLVMTKNGGHCGFLSDRGADDDGYWAEGRSQNLRRGRRATYAESARTYDANSV